MDLGIRLLAWLRTTIREPGLEFSEPPQPVAGGFDTRIFGFRLRSAPPALSGPLILRVLGRHHDPARVLHERATQNALVALGYPAPRALLLTTHAEPLGGPFVVMERLSGTVLPEARFFNMSSVLVRLQARLHALDPAAWLRALEGEGPWWHGSGTAASVRDVLSFEGHLAKLERRITRHGLDELTPAVRWLARHRPSHGGAPVICHGDFHPYNVLMVGGTVSGVVDWPHAIVADPEFDVATTRIILELAPVEATGLPAPLQGLARVGRRLLVRRYLRGYARRRPLDGSRLRYYEAAGCLKALIRIGESRRGAADDTRPPDPLDTSSSVRGLVERFARITGVTPTLPDLASARPRPRPAGPS